MLRAEERKVLVVGAGLAGLAVGKSLSDNHIPFVLVEKEEKMGGHSKNWACMATTGCLSCHSCLVFDYEDAVASSQMGQIYLSHELSRVEQSSAGNRKVRIKNIENGDETELEVYCIVLATGFDIFDPGEKPFWGYGRIDGIMTLADLNRMMRLDQAEQLNPNHKSRSDLAFFQCVGSRDKSIGRNYCSQYCCGAAIRTALKLIQDRPELHVTIFYIDLQLPDKTLPALMTEARDKGVRFLQGVPGEIWPSQDGKLRVFSEVDGINVVEEFDRIILSVGQQPSSSAKPISAVTGAPLNEFGFFETRSLTDPVRSPEEGIYIAGSCSGPATIADSVLSAGRVVSAIVADMNQAR
ncbi:MAG: FAD-dependent oxidoreductase [Pseudomonadota bacterium]